MKSMKAINQSQSGASKIHPWSGFLPSRAVVMVRRSSVEQQGQSETPSSENISVKRSAQVPGLVPEELSSPSTPMASASARPAPATQAPSAAIPPILFISPHCSSAEMQTLLGKMIQAMGLQAEQAMCLDASSKISAAQLKSSKMIVAYGPQALRVVASELALGTPSGYKSGQTFAWGETQVMATHDLEQLSKSPAAKKETWAHLQQVAKMMGLTLPKKGAAK